MVFCCLIQIRYGRRPQSTGTIKVGLGLAYLKAWRNYPVITGTQGEKLKRLKKAFTTEDCEIKHPVAQASIIKKVQIRNGCFLALSPTPGELERAVANQF